MEHKRLRHMGEGVKAKKSNFEWGARAIARHVRTRETPLSAERSQSEGRGADDAALLSNIGRFFSATAVSAGIDALSPTEHRPPLSVVYRTDMGNDTNGARSIPFSHTKPEKHKDSFNTFQLIHQRNQRKSFRFSKNTRGDKV